MGKVYDTLKIQLTIEKHKKDAEDCLKIYEKLYEISEGHVWDSEWRILVKTTFTGLQPVAKRIYKPSEIGYVFLRGIEGDGREGVDKLQVLERN